MFGICHKSLLIQDSGAYIAAVIITLLDLPSEHPDSSARSHEGRSLLAGLPEWIARCKLITKCSKSSLTM
jgi:hypothetical protein